MRKLAALLTLVFASATLAADYQLETIVDDLSNPRAPWHAARATTWHPHTASRPRHRAFEDDVARSTFRSALRICPGPRVPAGPTSRRKPQCKASMVP